MEVKDIGDFYNFKCPHCHNDIIVAKKELNCKIFRHGVYIKTGKPMNPHMNQLKCVWLAKTKQIYGCGKPFRVVNGTPMYVEICDYI